MSRRSLIKPPKRLQGEALTEWVRVAGELEATGILDYADRDALELYATTTARMIVLEKKIGDDYVRNGRVHPLARELHRITRELMRLCDRLGMTPLARAKLQAARARRDEHIRRRLRCTHS